MPCVQCKDTNFLVYIIVALFGVGSWIAIAGIWVELPLIVPQLPESWRLPSFLSIIIQVANVGPIGFTVINHFFKDKINERILIYVLLAINVVSCLLLAFFWKTTAIIGGENHSVVLLVFMFLLAFVSCSSSVIFIPFMTIFKPQYLTAFFIGQGFSGLIPSLVALGQGVGKSKCINSSVLINELNNESTFVLKAVYEEPHFPVENFLFFIFAMMCVCCIAYTLLLHLPLCKTQYAAEENHEMETVTAQEKLMETNDNSPTVSTAAAVSYVMIYLLILNGWINFLENGILLPTQTYSCLPYGNEVYHLTVTLANIVDPMASLMSFVFPSVKKSLITLFTIVATGSASYTLFISALSPTPILLYDAAGPALIIIAWVVTVGLLTFSKVSIAGILREKGKNALMWYGIVTQAGSLVGTVIMYLLINVASVFESSTSCGGG